jgi:hypothetical protein
MFSIGHLCLNVENKGCIVLDFFSGKFLKGFFAPLRASESRFLLRVGLFLSSYDNIRGGN